MSVVEPITAVDLCCGAGGWACAARGLPISIVAAAVCRQTERGQGRVEKCTGSAELKG